MKHFCKQLFTVFVLSITMITMAICFVACDDSDGNDNENEPLTFAEGTTIDDILQMFEEGIIESCTMQKYRDGVIASTYKCNGEIWYNSSFEEWSVYAVDENKLYSIGVDDNEEILYVWHLWDKDMTAVDNMKENLLNISQSNYVKEISVNANSVEISLVNYNETYIWTDFNSTELSIPQEYSNYKELAVEGSWAS